MSKLWILVANSSKAALYETPKAKLFNGHAKLTLVQNYTHPQSRKKSRDLITDRPGHASQMGKLGGGSLGEPSDVKQAEYELFAKELAGDLERGRVKHCFDNLVLVAPPQLMGTLHKKINHNHNLKSMLTLNIEKDYTNYKPELLVKYLGGYM